jgi:hypothetical protein
VVQGVSLVVLAFTVTITSDRAAEVRDVVVVEVVELSRGLLVRCECNAL